MRSDTDLNCICCNKPGRYSIQLYGWDGASLNEAVRYYIPNKGNREDSKGASDLQEVPFCPECMRKVEDNLRATILYLQAENDRLIIKPV